MEARKDVINNDFAEKESNCINGQSSASYLVWNDLTVLVPAGSKRKLLNQLSGYAQMGRILAVMGPSGSGKSTFLDSLAGQISSDVKEEGNISLCGRKKGFLNHNDLSYVTQENLFLGTLTVKETIAYAAHLRLSSEMTKAEIDGVVEANIKEMGLGDCTENRIDAGFACPRSRNPTDHFLRCISLDFDSQTPASSGFSMNMKTAEIKATLIQSYKSSKYSCKVRKKMQEIAATKQLSVLTHQSFINMYRDIGYSWLRIMLYILSSISAGILYFDIGYDDGAIINRGKFVSFLFGLMVCLSCGGVPFFNEELKVFHAKRLYWQYSETLFVLANFLSSLPFSVANSLLSGTTIFYMVKLHPGFSHYGYFCINFFCCTTIIESCMMVVNSFVPNASMAVVTGISVNVLMMMASQIFRLLADLPKFFWGYPMSYISFAKWAVEGQYKNVMTSLEFDSAEPGEPQLKGEMILKTTFAVLLFQLFVYKVLLLLVLRYKKRIAPQLRLSSQVLLRVS
ncbi:hypothetical protein ACJRO7_007527 [Eucalyptus globulus]|uniref:ABC transporter domain-containing protein n=1 Tax=Eucalyptus globulus TaxID=34317 RepID=A0ABD3ILD6_EUCGL